MYNTTIFVTVLYMYNTALFVAVLYMYNTALFVAVLYLFNITLFVAELYNTIPVVTELYKGNCLLPIAVLLSTFKMF